MVPTHRPVIREDCEDAVYLTKEEKYAALVHRVAACYFGTKQPVLLGTPNIEVSEILSKKLSEKGILHEVLNAKNHAREAEIIAKAGSERHEARRIDNQLRGRSGRQGDPGMSQFYLSLEDDVMRLFAPERMMATFRTLRHDAQAPISHHSLSKTIRQAQYKIEGNHFGIRKHLVEYEDVNSNQRDLFYGQRKEVLSGCSMDVLVFRMIVSAFPERESEFRMKYEQLRSGFDHVTFDSFARKWLLQTMDYYWMRHLDALELLKQDVALIGYGQKQPVVEYRVQAYQLFDQMLLEMQAAYVKRLLSTETVTVLERDRMRTQVVLPVSASDDAVFHGVRHVLLSGEPEQSTQVTAVQVHAEDTAGGTVARSEESD